MHSTYSFLFEVNMYWASSTPVIRAHTLELTLAKVASSMDLTFGASRFKRRGRWVGCSGPETYWVNLPETSQPHFWAFVVNLQIRVSAPYSVSTTLSTAFAIFSCVQL